MRGNGGPATRRLLVALPVTLLGLALVTAVLAPLRGQLALASVTLIYLVTVAAVAALGGPVPALLAAVCSDLAVNFFFVRPYRTFTVDSRDNLITLVIYLLVAVAVGVTVDLVARQRAEAARRGVEAELLARVTAGPVTDGSLDSLLEHVRVTFGMRSAALLEHGDDGAVREVARVGAARTGVPELSVPAADGLELACEGQPVMAPDRRMLTSLAAAAARLLEAQRLAGQAARARELDEIDALRTALLAAVGHDLRTPLAGIKAAVSGLREPDLALSPEAAGELLATVEESADRLDALVENLLAASRVQAGVLSADPRPVALDQAVAGALLHLPDLPTNGPVTVRVPEDLPPTLADPGLLDRVIANLVDNARRAAPGGPVELRAEADGGRVALAVVDHGPGVPEAERDRIFAPFQRLDDRTADGGLGLGLAICRGFVQAMGGTVVASGTPGGGLTVTVSLPVAA